MKFTVSIEIAQPREKVAQLLADPATLPNWLRGLQRHESVSGELGEVGTKSLIVMQVGRRTVESTETIVRQDPADLTAISSDSEVYFEREIDTKGVSSTTRERLTEAGPGKTLWESENEYRFSSLPMRLLAPLMGGTFRKETLKNMEDFKAFAEHGTDVRETKG